MPARPARTISFFAVGAVVLAVALAGRERGTTRRAEPVALAERTDLEVTLIEAGTLEAARSVTLASEIRSNRAKIVSLLADGSWVKTGDEIVRFDPTPFEEARDKASAELRDAEAAAGRVDQERKLQVAKAEEALEAARYRMKLAELELESYQKGTGALQVREAEVRRADTSTELDRARRDLADLEEMRGRGFVSEGELDRQRQKVEEVARQDALERDRLKAAREVTFPRDLERAKSEVAEARDAVARAEAVLYHTHDFYRAAIEAAGGKVGIARTALRAAEEELEKTVLTAPLDGFLILQDIPLETGRRKAQVGDSVWSGQPIATLPDLSQMVALTRVREIDLHRVAPGLTARVDVEAYPELSFEGRVDFVGSLAEDSPDSPWKFFSVRLLLGRTDPRLRPGMSVRVRFRLDSVRNALVIPLDAVFSRAGRDVCYVRRGGEVWQQPIALGKRSDTHVEVREGISAGEELLLSAPDGPVRRLPPPEPGA